MSFEENINISQVLKEAGVQDREITISKDKRHRSTGLMMEAPKSSKAGVVDWKTEKWALSVMYYS